MRPTFVNVIASKFSGKTQFMVLLYLYLSELEVEAKGRARIIHANPELHFQVKHYQAHGSTKNTKASAVDVLEFELDGRRIVLRAYPGERLIIADGIRPEELAAWLRRDADLTLFLVNGFTVKKETALHGILGFLATAHEKPASRKKESPPPSLAFTIELAFRKTLAYELDLHGKRKQGAQQADEASRKLELDLEADLETLRSYEDARIRYVPGVPSGTRPFAIEEVRRAKNDTDDGEDFFEALESITRNIVGMNVDLRTLGQVCRAVGEDCAVIQTFADMIPFVKGMTELPFQANFALIHGETDRRRSQDVIAYQLAHQLDLRSPTLIKVLVDEPTNGPADCLNAIVKRIEDREKRDAAPRLWPVLQQSSYRLPWAIIATSLAFAIDEADAAPGWKIVLWLGWLAMTLLLLAASEYLTWSVRHADWLARKRVVDPTAGRLNVEALTSAPNADAPQTAAPIAAAPQAAPSRIVALANHKSIGSGKK